MKEIKIIGWILVAGVVTSGPALGQKAEKRVAVVTDGASLRVGDREVAKIGRGQIFVAHGSRGAWWNVSGGQPRWIRKSDALPLERALAHFDQTIRQNPGDAGAYHARGAIRAAQGNHDRAIRDFDEALRIDPDSPSTLADRGSARFRKGEYDRAVDDFSEAIRLKPDYVSAYANRAAVRTAIKQYEGAIDDYTEALRLSPRLASAYRNRGVIWKILGRYDKALSDANACLEINPKDPQAYNNRAWIRATCPDPTYRDGGAAIESASRACELTAWKHPGYLDTLAAAYAEAGQFEKAVEVESRAIDVAPLRERTPLRERREQYRAEKPYREQAVASSS